MPTDKEVTRLKAEELEKRMAPTLIYAEENPTGDPTQETSGIPEGKGSDNPSPSRQGTGGHNGPGKMDQELG